MLLLIQLLNLPVLQALTVIKGQFYIYSEDCDDPSLEDCFTGQENGLCGTVNSTMIFFITRLHSGNIHLDVNTLSSEPAIQNESTEIVEASFEVSDSSFSLNDWNGDISLPMNLNPGTYKVRYSVIDFGKAEESGLFEQGNVEFYKVEIWPCPLENDKVLKVTSDLAKYWHVEAFS